MDNETQTDLASATELLDSAHGAGTNPMSPRATFGGKRLERLVNISDAITAVAITLLAVPLIGLLAPDPNETFGNYLWARAGSIVAFAFTFAIVFGQWRVHNRILSDLVGYDSVVFWINATWLAGIAFLPWPSNLVGLSWESGDVLTTGAGGPIAVFYWFSLAFVILMAETMRTYVMRNPALVDPQHWPTWHASRAAWSARSLILLLGFLACGILWYFSAIAGLVCLVAIVALLAISRRRMGSQHGITSH